jgi:hypothetical protein
VGEAGDVAREGLRGAIHCPEFYQAVLDKYPGTLTS